MCGFENIHCFNGRSLGGFNGFIKTLPWSGLLAAAAASGSVI